MTKPAVSLPHVCCPLSMPPQLGITAREGSQGDADAGAGEVPPVCHHQSALIDARAMMSSPRRPTVNARGRSPRPLLAPRGSQLAPSSPRCPPSLCRGSLPVLAGHILPKKVTKPTLCSRIAVQPSLLNFLSLKKCYESTCDEDS